MRLWTLTARAALVAAGLGAPMLVLAQRARGVVTETTSKVPVGDATVTLLNADAHAVASVRTGADGEFTIVVPSSARYLLTVRRIGYRGFTSAELTLGQRDTTLHFEITSTATELPRSVTRARAPRREWGRDGFVKRRELGAGAFLTRLDVLAREPTFLEEALQGVEGLQVVPVGDGLQVRSLRGRRCLRLFVNRLPSRVGLDILPKHVYGIEVYREYKEVPAEFRLDAYPCGLINVWMRAAWAPPTPGSPKRAPADSVGTPDPTAAIGAWMTRSR